MKKLSLLLVSSLIILVLIAGGCNLNNSTTNGGTSAGDLSPASGVINFLDIDPTTLDPAVSTESTSAQYILQIYSGLIKLDANLEPTPDIAESWSVDPAGTTYTFTLQKGVKFQDGKSLTAADFKYSWERAANPSTGSITAETYLGDIVGVKEVLAGKTSSITGVKVRDDYTLEVTIDTPKSYFLYKLSYPTTFVVDKANVSKGSNWWHTPNGTGPFKLSAWKEGESLKLVRNENYYGEPAHLAAVQYSFYSGLGMDLYETGDIDVTGVSTNYIDAVMDKNGPFYSDLRISSDLSFTYIGFNCRQAPFNDPAIRQAFNLAIDKDKVISLVFRDMALRADGILPPEMPGYNSNLEGLKFDPAAARALIQSSTYGAAANLPEITLTTYGYGGGVGQLLQSLVYQWQENLGVKVTIRQLDTERYFYNTKEEIDQMFLMGWSADYPHPQDFIDILFHGDSGYNYGTYTNTAVDDLIVSANQSINETESFKLYQQAEQQMVDDAACLPLTFGTNYYLVKNYVQDYQLNALGFAMLDKVSILPH